jgi:hypothetical protein
MVSTVRTRGAPPNSGEADTLDEAKAALAERYKRA